jgi:transglutaminase-like putative cysteine protease
LNKSTASRFTLVAVLMSFAALAVWALPSSATHARTRTRQTPSRSFDFRYVVDVPAPPAGSHRMKLWVPLPYEDSYQSVSDLRINAPVRFKIRREREYNDRYAYFDLDAAQIKQPFQIELTVGVKRFEHRVPLQTVADLPARSEAVVHFLQPDRLVPIDGEIAQLSREQTQGVSEPLEKARKIYDYVIATMHYDHDGTGWGRGDAVWACNAKHGNCTDFHSLFIGMARAAGIPARFEIGFPIPLNAHEGAISGYHCWAEFFVNGIGWIPIDASQAWQDPSKKNYFFGATDANRVMFSMGRDISLNPPQAAEPLNYFVYPYAEVDGKPFADLKHAFSFRDDAGAATTTAQNRP